MEKKNLMLTAFLLSVVLVVSLVSAFGMTGYSVKAPDNSVVEGITVKVKGDQVNLKDSSGKNYTLSKGEKVTIGTKQFEYRGRSGLFGIFGERKFDITLVKPPVSLNQSKNDTLKPIEKPISHPIPLEILPFSREVCCSINGEMEWTSFIQCALNQGSTVGNISSKSECVGDNLGCCLIPNNQTEIYDFNHSWVSEEECENIGGIIDPNVSIERECNNVNSKEICCLFSFEDGSHTLGIWSTVDYCDFFHNHLETGLIPQEISYEIPEEKCGEVCCKTEEGAETLYWENCSGEGTTISSFSAC